jgi:rubrerythrin
LLEYTGAQKISKSVASTHPKRAVVLDHLADEARHAYAFKRLYEHVAALDSDGEEPGYLCVQAAETYFRRLDERATTWMTELAGEQHQQECYLLVTTLVERRAMEMYPLYRSATDIDEVADELQQIVVEEQDHRVAIEENCKDLLAKYGVDSLDPVDELEAELFDDLWDEISTEVGVT